MRVSVSFGSSCFTESVTDFDEAFVVLRLLAEQYPDWRFLAISAGSQEVLLWVEAGSWFTNSRLPETQELLKKVLAHPANAGIIGRKVL